MTCGAWLARWPAYCRGRCCSPARSACPSSGPGRAAVDSVCTRRGSRRAPLARRDCRTRRYSATATLGPRSGRCGRVCPGGSIIRVGCGYTSGRTSCGRSAGGTSPDAVSFTPMPRCLDALGSETFPSGRPRLVVEISPPRRTSRMPRCGRGSRKRASVGWQRPSASPPTKTLSLWTSNRGGRSQHSSG